MRTFLLRSFFLLLLSGVVSRLSAQLLITQHSSAQELAQKLVGEGVSISNVHFTGIPEMAGFFNNQGGTQIHIDSGIVLTNGRARTDRVTNKKGVNGDGSTPAISVDAHNPLSLPGDGDLTTLIGQATNDACVLEFDFVPLGDSIKFNYIFSSEEYPDFACPPTPGAPNYNDVFAFFIDGPGFPARTNIALIPGTTDPVTINNINDQGCAPYPGFYVDNSNNRYFTHNGHTKVFTALAKVIPCQTYHLKLVIADVVDSDFDSGVFLAAKSLSSNAIGMNNLTQTDPVSGLSYLVEGCTSGAFNIRRPHKDPTPLVVNLQYVGTAINGVDYQLLPSTVTIPANDSFVTVNVIPIIDGAPEGIETIKVYALAGCTSLVPSDSTLIQIRDYDILDLTPDTAYICKNGSLLLQASTGYTTYQWEPDPTLSSTIIRDPVATPTASATTYICTATIGTCNARDSVFIHQKDLEFISNKDVNCRNGLTGEIKVEGGYEWTAPVSFSLDGTSWQPDSSFYNLAAGTYWVKMKDATCIDSVKVVVAQAFPDLEISSLTTTEASCNGDADGTITIVGAGGNSSYSYSIDGINFQASNIFSLAAGTQTITIRDGNGCTAKEDATIPLNNIVTVDAGPVATICEGTSIVLPATSNATSFAWTPAASLDHPTSLQPTANPVTDTRYYLVATTGICSKIDSIDVLVRPAPTADAGADVDICYGKTLTLHGNGGIKFEWSPSTNFISPATSQHPDIKAKNTIVYSLMVEDVFGCRSLVADEVKINVTPSVKINAGPDTIAAMNQPVRLSVRELSSAGVVSYTWTPAFDLSDASSASPIATLRADQRFVVTGTTADGCEGRDEIIVKVYKGPDIYMPTGFTPNNDGLNDLLMPVPVGVRDFKYLRVYNRWGQLVFQTNNAHIGWNGYWNGVQQPTGTYVWMAEGTDYKGNQISRKGVVTIIR